MTVYFPHQRLRLIGQQRESHVIPVNDVHFFIDNHIHAFGKGQKPVVGVVELGDFAFFIHQQSHVFQAVLGYKLAVRFGRIPRQAENFDFFGFVFFNILLKLNKLADSKLGVVFGIESQYHGAMIFDSIAEFPYVALLIGQCKIRGYLAGNRGGVFCPC
jgi:hypothetical protein